MSEQKSSNKKNHLLSWIVFLPTLAIVLLTTILGIFPALSIILFDKARFPVETNAFEPGIWMFPVLFANIVIFAAIILYRKNKLPQNIIGLFRSILNFEISERTALVIVGVLICLYAILNAGELYTKEHWADFAGVDHYLQSFSFDEFEIKFKMISYSLGFISMEIFGTYRVASFLASIGILFFTYLVTVQISKKRFAGIIALGLVLQSDGFLVYDTLITYPIIWIMFFLLAMYFVLKSFPLSPILSPIFYVCMVLSHPISLGFFPIIIAFITLANLPKRKKILLLSLYSVIVVGGLVLVYTEIIYGIPISFEYGTETSSDLSRIIYSSAAIFSQFRYDALLVAFLLPLVVGLFLVSNQGISNANAVLALIGGVLLLVMLIPFATGQGNTPYRVLPLVFIFAIGVGTLLSKNINLQENLLAYSAFRESSKKSDDEDESEKNNESSDIIENSKHKSPSELRRTKKREKTFGRS